MKRIFSFLLILLLLFSFSPLTFAAVSDAYTAAEALYQLGLFKGVSTFDSTTPHFDLEREPTRIEAMVMLIRLLGKEQEALDKNWEHPFVDVPKWADPYIGFAYKNKLTNGVSSTQFGGDTATAAMYLTFMLRVLGYSDQGGQDFTWSSPFALAERIGISDSRVNTQHFMRADAVLISFQTLSAKLKGFDITLAEVLINNGVFTADQYHSVMHSQGSGGPQGPVTGYTVTRHDYSAQPGRIYYEMFFDTVTFSGQSIILDYVNQAVIDKEEKYKTDWPLGNYHDEWIDANFRPGQPVRFQLEPHTIDFVHYDEHYISIVWMVDWYIGGVHNGFLETINLNLDTLNQVSIYELLGNDAYIVIRNSIIDYFTQKADFNALNASLRYYDSYDLTKLVFYFDSENVYVTFGQGELSQGKYILRLSIPRN